MTEPTALPETNNFGLTRIGVGEALSKNGYAVLDLDRIKIDDVLQALVTHSHTGEPALGDPTDPPDLLGLTEGGDLPAATTYFYKVAYIDQYNLETAASPEESVTTPDPIPTPPAPATTVASTGGFIEAGLYAYVITQTDATGGETDPSVSSTVRVGAGGLSTVTFDFPDLGLGAVSTSVYRARPGQTIFYYLTTTTADAWTDLGDIEDQTVIAPVSNTTNSANSIQVTIPLDFIPLGCASWKIYRATFSGGYGGNSLVHNVTEGVTDTSIIPVSVWTDVGDLLEAGFPHVNSSTIPSPPAISLGLGLERPGLLGASHGHGAQCLSMFGPGVLTDAAVLSVTETASPITPTGLTAFFRTPPSGASVVRLRVQDTTGVRLELRCTASSVQPGDPPGYFHADYNTSAADGIEFGVGTITVLVYVDDGPTLAADVNVTLWF